MSINRRYTQQLLHTEAMALQTLNARKNHSSEEAYWTKARLIVKIVAEHWQTYNTSHIQGGPDTLRSEMSLIILDPTSKLEQILILSFLTRRLKLVKEMPVKKNQQKNIHQLKITPPPSILPNKILINRHRWH